VARNTSLRARRSGGRRQAHERALEESAEPCRVPAPSAESDLRPILDEELARLPERYRAPLVLCYLEGRSIDEAAAELSLARGTVASRMSRGRDLLRKRLAGRGLVLSASAFAAQLAESAAGAAVPAATLHSLVPAGFVAGTGVREGAAVLAREALHRMFWAKAVRWAGLLIAGLLLFGAGAAAMRGRAANPVAGNPPPTQTSADFSVLWRFDDGPPKDIQVLEGQWTFQAGKPGRMRVPRATLLLPTPLPQRPFALSVKTSARLQESSTATTAGWVDGQRYCPRTNWAKNGLLFPDDRCTWYFAGRWVVLYTWDPQHRALIHRIHDYYRPYPGQRVHLRLQNLVIEEIELHSVRPEALPPEFQHLEQLIQTMPIGPLRIPMQDLNGNWVEKH
jgi:hypothetical protein